MTTVPNHPEQPEDAAERRRARNAALSGIERSQRFPWRADEDRVLLAAGELHPDDDSYRATVLRELAESIAEHRAAWERAAARDGRRDR